jgi:GNAT superfamily N-acetyltransferase
MIFPETIQTPGGELSVAPASSSDLYPILRLFDETVNWLNARGLGNQWGNELFSTSLDRHKQFLQWIHTDALFVAHFQGQIVGSLALNPIAPWYIAQRWELFPISSLYLEAFTTSRALAGRGLGRSLLMWAEHYAREIGKTAIWLDCWADNPALIHYYEQAGFMPREIFLVHAWRGQLFEKQLAE